MSMFDDLDPEHTPSADAALPIVARRAHTLRTHRRLAIAGLCGVIVAVGAFSSIAFGSSGGGHPQRITVSNSVTTTRPPKTEPSPSSTPSTRAATSTSAPASTTTTSFRPAVTTPPATTPYAGDLVVTFDPAHLVIRSGTTATISWTLANIGNGPAGYTDNTCGENQLWPADQSQTDPVAWPVPKSPLLCAAMGMAGTLAPNQSRTFHLTVLAGLYAQGFPSTGFVPAPPGQAFFKFAGAALPVTITPPKHLPLTIVHPSAVTVASGAAEAATLTLTNHLGYAVIFHEQGPCAGSHNATCGETFANSTPDLRFRPYANAQAPLWTTLFILAPHESISVYADVDGTASLRAPSFNNPNLPPGVYYFDWDGQRVKFTVTAPTP